MVGSTPQATVSDPTTFVALARFTSTGALDVSFSGDGKIGFGESTGTYGDYDGWGEYFSVLRTSDGGYRFFDASDSYRADDASTAETRFNADGVMQTTSGYLPNAFVRVIQLKDGTFLGLINPGHTHSRSYDRYTSTFSFFDVNDKDLGSKDTTFDTGITPTIVDSNGKLVLGSISQTDQYLLYRFGTDGKLDASFGQGGRTSFTDYPEYSFFPPTIWPLGDGRIVMAGGGRDPVMEFNVAMQASRVNSDGSRDPSVKLDLHYEAVPGACTLLPHGNLSVCYVQYSEWEDAAGVGVLIRNDGSTSGRR